MLNQQQIPLDFLHFDEKTFNQYVFGKNSELDIILNDPKQQVIFIWGEPFSGKTHLLSALYQQYLKNNKSAIYLPLSINHETSSQKIPIQMLENIEQSDLVCIDDIETIAGNREWEEALFFLYNQMLSNGHKLLISGKNNAENINFCLKDLKSRLQWGITYHLKPLDDNDKIQILQNRAEIKSFSLSSEVAQFLVNRVSRNLEDLLQLLDKLDFATLSEQRKLTIPFVKKTLGL